jgi:hypothetical protein
MQKAFLRSYDRSRTAKETAMNRLVTCMVAGAMLAGTAGLVIAGAQPNQGSVLIAGDRPVTAEQVQEKLRLDGWSNIVVSLNGRYIQVTASRDGQMSRMAVDSQTGRLHEDGDDDDDY